LCTAADYLKTHPDIKRVRFVLFGQEAYNVFAKQLGQLSDFLKV
jgi:O-acetyl-ADP-ribose deacetylase (regulator of RNase III)